MPDEHDALLIKGSLEDPRMFEAVFERHYDAVRRYAQARVGLDAGEEIAAQVFLIALVQRASFDPSYPSARPWLLGIATNLIRRHARDERARWKVLRRLGSFPSVEYPLDVEALDAALVAPRIFQVLDAFRREDRETFLLYCFAELTYAEIALTLDIPVGTVRSRIFRVRRAVREREDLQSAINEQIDDV